MSQINKYLLPVLYGCLGVALLIFAAWKFLAGSATENERAMGMALLGVVALVYGAFKGYQQHRAETAEARAVEEHERAQEAEQNAFNTLISKNSDLFEKLSIPFGQIVITPKSEAKLTDGKFGGQPYWPKGMPYPVDSRGDKLSLLAQVNCKDVPATLDWPDKGIVQFFIAASADDFMSGLDLTDQTKQDGFRVIYHENTDLPSEEKPMDYTDAPSPLFDPAQSIKFDIKLGKMLPSIYATHVNPKLAEAVADLEDAYENYRQSTLDEQFGGLANHRIGGYPQFCQEDPRDESQAKTAYSVLLLQVDSDPDNGIQWGDLGEGQFFTSTARLKKRDFTDVLYNWACH